MTHAVDNLTNVKVSEASRSRILDTDYAESTAELARTQIIQQAGTAMLVKNSCHNSARATSVAVRHTAVKKCWILANCESSFFVFD